MSVPVAERNERATQMGSRSRTITRHAPLKRSRVPMTPIEASALRDVWAVISLSPQLRCCGPIIGLSRLAHRYVREAVGPFASGHPPSFD